ncbi:phospholipid-binding protein MlaC [Piscinibacterium candidicorallinum]|jgi:phospholipid transport system substrate-binding protein|uniref:Phospholipid-binding protein MlaC n=1 Tax=Piscinibacterium candidicorallinum TaxID=1793872 RepID=A0ABV7H5E0_9BURK
MFKLPQILRTLIATAALAFVGSAFAQTAAPTAPDALVKSVMEDVLATISSDKALQSGDIRKLSALVEQKVMPHVNFQRTTALAVGRAWRQATPEQQAQLQEQFRGILVKTYANAMGQAANAKINMRPLRAADSDTEVTVRTQVVPQRGDPIQLDYRMEKTPAGWKAYDVNILGLWLVDSYRASFQQEVDKSGIDGLIKSLVERNRRLENAKS